jgi:hypothetical protein
VDAYFSKAAVLDDFFKFAAEIELFLLSVVKKRPPIRLLAKFAATSAA